MCPRLSSSLEGTNNTLFSFSYSDLLMCSFYPQHLGKHSSLKLRAGRQLALGHLGALQRLALKCCPLLLPRLVEDPPFPSSWTNEKRNPKITDEFSMTENPGLLAV